MAASTMKPDSKLLEDRYRAPALDKGLDIIELLHPGSRKFTDPPKKYVQVDLETFRDMAKTLPPSPPTSGTPPLPS